MRGRPPPSGPNQNQRSAKILFRVFSSESAGPGSPPPTDERDALGVHVVQAAVPQRVHHVVDGALEVGRAGQAGAERVDEQRQRGPRPAPVAVVVAHVRQHALDDGPVAGDLGPQRTAQPTAVAGRLGRSAR